MHARIMYLGLCFLRSEEVADLLAGGQPLRDAAPVVHRRRVRSATKSRPLSRDEEDKKPTRENGGYEGREQRGEGGERSGFGSVPRKKRQDCERHA